MVFPETLEEISQSLTEFSAQITDCLTAANWDKLMQVLQLRQTFFEQVLTKPDQKILPELAVMVEAVLQQDAEAMARIEASKKDLLQQFNMLETGRKALKAYRSG